VAIGLAADLHRELTSSPETDVERDDSAVVRWGEELYVGP